MSFGFGVGDILAVSQLSWKIYRACKDSGDDFRSISDEVSNLHTVLRIAEEDLAKECQTDIDAQRKDSLEEIAEGCRSVLEDLDRLLKKYESLSTQEQRTWDRMRWGLEDMAGIRQRLTYQVGLINAFNAALERYVFWAPAYWPDQR